LNLPHKDWTPEEIGLSQAQKIILHKRDRLLKKIWKDGSEVTVDGDDYKEILNVRFSIHFMAPEEKAISHFKVIHAWINREFSRIENMFDLDAFTRRAYCFFPELEIGEPPCNLVYLYIFRENRLNLIVFIRSFDVLKKFVSDVNTALWCLQIMSYRTGMDPGRVTFFVVSCHVKISDTLEGYK